MTCFEANHDELRSGYTIALPASTLCPSSHEQVSLSMLHSHSHRAQLLNGKSLASTCRDKYLLDRLLREAMVCHRLECLFLVVEFCVFGFVV